MYAGLTAYGLFIPLDLCCDLTISLILNIEACPAFVIAHMFFQSSTEHWLVVVN